MSERVYIAASFEHREEVAKLVAEVEARGHAMTADWTKHKEIAAIESEAVREELKRAYATEDAEAVRTATVFAMLCGERNSTGKCIEFGIALGAQVLHIFLIGSPDETQLFYTHQSLTVLPDKDSFLEFLEGLTT